MLASPRKSLGLAAALGLAFWAADAALDSIVGEGGSFLDCFLLHPTSEDLVARGIVLVSLLVFGAIRARAAERERRARRGSDESQRTLSTLMSNLPGMAYRCRNDRLWTMEFVSDGCAELTGHQPAELLNNASLSYNDLIHDEDREPVWRAVQAALAARQPFELNYRLVRAGGEERHVWERGRGVYAPDGRLVALEGFIADVSKQRRAELALRVYAERLKVLRGIDTGVLAARSPAAIAQAVVQRAPQLVACHRASVVLFDLARREFEIPAIWQDGHTVVGADSRLPLDSSFGELDRLRAGHPTEWPDLDAVGELPALLARLHQEGMRSTVVVPLVSGSDLIGTLNLASREKRAFNPEAIEIAREIATPLALAFHHARLHAQVMQEAAELERRVAERTADLQAFAYSVSHDLRGPLRAIDGFAGALDEECGDQLGQDGQRLLEIVRGNARAMRQLLDDLLAFYRLGHEAVEPVDLDLAVMAREEFARVLRHEPGRRACLEVADLPPARGDAPMVRLALANLLANALKFTRPREEAVIEVVAAPDPDGGPTAYGVRDNGVGFDPAQADRLFGVFQRLHPPDEYEGTGVGLAIVRRVVERHGGSVRAEALPGGGAAFWFTLPTGAAP